MNDCIIIDASNLMFSMFHGMTPLSNKQNYPTHATFGFARKLLEFEKRYPTAQKIVVFDAFKELMNVQNKTPSVPLLDSSISRKDLLSDYKGTRNEVPEDLKKQIKPCASMAKNLGWHVFIVGEPLEADDVAYSFSQLYAEQGYRTILATNDKDMLCAMRHPNAHIWRFDIKPVGLVGPDYVVEKFGIQPEKMGLYLALHGDKVDNVNGLDGCGPVKTAELCNTFNNMEEIIQAALSNSHPHIIKKSLREKIIANQKDLYLYEAITTLNVLPLDIHNLPFAPRAQMNANLDKLLTMFELDSLRTTIDNIEKKNALSNWQPSM